MEKEKVFFKTTMLKIFSDFLMVEQILVLPRANRKVIITKII